MIRWPARAAKAIRLLFEPLQEIDVYVEDANDEAFYRALLSSATGGQITVARVFSLGGKSAVIQAAQSHDHSVRRALFIVDGDLHWVRGGAAPEIKGLHTHEAYCIENLLLCRRALGLILSQEMVVPLDDAIVKLTYPEWRTSVTGQLTRLFAAYATLQEFDPTVATVSTGINSLCEPRRPKVFQKLDAAKVRFAEEQAIAAAEKKGNSADVRARFEQIHARIQSLPEPLHAISGKDHLLPLIDFHLQSLGCRIRRGTLRMRLAATGDMQRFGSLAGSLTAAAQGAFAK